MDDDSAADAPKPYQSAAEVLADRVAWSLACLHALAVNASTRGWINRSPDEVRSVDVSASTLRAQLHRRVASTPFEVRVLPMEWLRIRLALSAAEHDLIWLLACVEADPGVARAASVFAVGDGPELSVQLLRRIIPVSTEEIDRITNLRLVEMGTQPIHRRPARALDRVVELAVGELRLDPFVAQLGELVPALDDDTTPNDTAISTVALIVAKGIEGSGRGTLLRPLASRVHRGTLEIRVRDLATDRDLLKRQLRSISREAQLFDVVPLLRELPARGDVSDVIDSELLRSFPGVVMATCEETPAVVTSRPIVVRAVPTLDVAEREAVWRSHLPDAPQELLAQAASRYAITPGAIVASARNVAAARQGVAPLTIDSIHAGIRDHLGQRLGSLAKRIEWKQTWDDLVLPEAQREQVSELIARVQHRSRVLDEQGFGAKVAKGHGIVALMSGEPGTGKTMVAGLIASALGLDLYQVDLSVVVSKYIGETEKGLARLFDAAESGHIVLLFDEADALFAKRSEVKSSNDRYANLETNYLLQRLEAFAGISILTTNNEAALDDAFRRRIAVHIKFPMPEEDERVRLWRAMFPPRAQVAGEIDIRRLARDFEMSGGHIKNAVLRAAYLAAASGSPITMAHLRRAARTEYEAMGRIVTSASSL